MEKLSFEELLKVWPSSEKEVIKEKEKVFENYLDFPQEVRAMVINEMQPDDRCRFTRCSKLSNKEAKASKNFIFSLEIGGFPKNSSLIYVYGAYTQCSLIPQGFSLHFEEQEDGMKYIECKDLRHRKLWKTNLDKSTNLIKLAVEQFKTSLQLYQNTIKKLVISGPNFIFEGNVDLGIESLRRLKSIHIFNSSDVRYFTSKTNGNFEKFSFENYGDGGNTADLEEIYHVRDYLYLPRTKLTVQKFQRLISLNVEIHIGDLTESDVFNFIRSWQDGSIGRVVEQYVWRIFNTGFDVKRFQRLFGAENHNFYNGPFEIRRFKKDERDGMLFCSYGEIRFIGKYRKYLWS